MSETEERPKKFEELTPEEFIQFMNEQGYALVQIAGDRWFGILKFIYTTAIIKGNARDYDIGYEDRWCYHTTEDAVIAFYAWQNKEFEGEPHGWHRNPKTGRRRPDGDEKKEVVEW